MEVRMVCHLKKMYRMYISILYVKYIIYLYIPVRVNGFSSVSGFEMQPATTVATIMMIAFRDVDINQQKPLKCRW